MLGFAQFNPTYGRINFAKVLSGHQGAIAVMSQKF
jgi:hypothetical protein